MQPSNSGCKYKLHNAAAYQIQHFLNHVALKDFTCLLTNLLFLFWLSFVDTICRFSADFCQETKTSLFEL